MSNQPDLDHEALWRQYQLNLCEAIQLANEHNLTEAIPRAKELRDEIRQLSNPLANLSRGNVQDLIDDRQLELDNMVPVINLSIMVKTLAHALAFHPFMAAADNEWDAEVLVDLYDPSL